MQLTTTSVRDTTLADKLLNIFVSPGDVFEEVVVSPPTPVCWLAPMPIVCLTGVLSLLVMPAGELDPARAGQLTASDASASPEVGPTVPHTAAVTIVTVAASAIGGTLWSTSVLWLIGRVFLKTRFSFFKTLEVVALSGMILGLGTIVTALLGLATGDASARPALSLFAGQPHAVARLHTALEAANFFHLWTTTVLAVGLSRLARVSFSESAFWVFGYWVALRAAMICFA
jgi:hypothetical protein